MCQISGIALKKFDRRLLHLKALEVLDLSSNQIIILPESIHTLTKLKQLHLNHNEIKVLPSTFVNSTRVICLDISHNKVNMIINSKTRQEVYFNLYLQLRFIYRLYSKVAACVFNSRYLIPNYHVFFVIVSHDS